MAKNKENLSTPSLVVALDLSRRRAKKKKMAQGGMVNESDASEHRPMPEERNKDSEMVYRNSSKKPLVESQWDSRPDIKQASGKVRTTPIKHPKMVPSTGFTARLRDQEDDLQESAKVNNGPQRQPPEQYNELEADKKGPDVPALHMKRMAKGGMINNEVSMNEAEEDRVEHPSDLESDNDQMRPPKDEYMADHFAEGGMAEEPESKKGEEDCTSRPDMGWGAVLCRAEGGDVTKSPQMPPADKARDFAKGMSGPSLGQMFDNVKKAFSSSDKDHKAEGGSVSEEDIHPDMVSAIMHKRRKRMAEGGMADIEHENNVEHPNSFYHQNEVAALKENYDSDMLDVHQPMDSNEHGDDIDSDDHDRVSAIRKRMKSRMK